MPKLFSTKKTVSIVIDDYAIRMVNHGNNQNRNTKHLKEKLIPAGLLEYGRIMDEIEFYDFMKETVREWGIKRRNVLFYVPDSLLIMKKVSYPATLKTPEEIKGHFLMELGQTFYLPFENPIFDIAPLPANDEKSLEREGLIFAVPEDEVRKYTHIFEDCDLIPIKADVRSIGIYRYFKHFYPELEADATLFFEVNLSSISISIFTNHRPEFIRYLDLEVDLENWKSDSGRFAATINWIYDGDETHLLGLIDDQLVELERIMSFFRYSLYKGEKSISQIILLGDMPNLEALYEKVSNRFEIPVHMMKAYLSPQKNIEISRSFIPALGLTIKGEAK